MSTQAFRPRPHGGLTLPLGISVHWAWLLGGFGVAFLVPYLLADRLGLHRDLYYGVYAVAVVGLLLAWAFETGYDVVAAVRRHWAIATALGIAAGGLLVFVVVRTEEATARPDGLELAGAVLWRGVVYGVADGLLLSVFPILVVFAALSGTHLYRRRLGKVVAGIAALAAAVAMTAVYHAGYSEFRSSKMADPLRGSVMWSVPTLVTLNPIGAPIAHASMHVSAVLSSYETDTFLPPHD